MLTSGSLSESWASHVWPPGSATWGLSQGNAGAPSPGWGERGRFALRPMTSRDVGKRGFEPIFEPPGDNQNQIYVN